MVGQALKLRRGPDDDCRKWHFFRRKWQKKFDLTSFGTLPNLSPPLLFLVLPNLEFFILDVFVLPFVEIISETAETISLSLKTRRTYQGHHVAGSISSPLALL